MKELKVIVFIGFDGFSSLMIVRIVVALTLNRRR